MGNLILNSLEIQRFRGFRHLQIERLGRVNLIVGKNNVGKSSLLEALQLYARRGYPTLIWEFLRARDEGKPVSSRRIMDDEELLASLRYLFYGRHDIRAVLEPIVIGPINTSESKLSISVGWYVTQTDEAGELKSRLLRPEEYDTVEELSPRFIVQLGSQLPAIYALNPYPSPGRSPRSELKEINSTYSNANGLSRKQVGELWDRIALTGLEKEVLASLRIIAPGVEGFTLVDDTSLVLREERGRIPIVKIASLDEPLPLGSLGGGMQRMLSIALALVNARDGILLVDEIENGLHYLVLPDLWKLIFKLADRLNVQVFATTHSWDCIEGFQKAAQEDHQEEGLLIRLQSTQGAISAVLYDEEELAIATREQIEVR